MKLTFETFIDRLALHPGEAEPKDLWIVTAASVACFILTAGIFHLILAIRAYGLEERRRKEIIEFNNAQYCSVVGGKKSYARWRKVPIANSQQVESLKNIKTYKDLIQVVPDCHNPHFRLTQEQSDQIYKDKPQDAVLIQLNPFGEEIFVNNKLRWTFYWDDPTEQEDSQIQEIINFVSSCNAKGERVRLAGKLIFDSKGGSPEYLQLGTFSKNQPS